MRGRRGLFSLFTSLPEHHEDKNGLSSGRRRRHSSGDRETWSRKVEYFFASLGYAVGLGNIWRFPYLCYRNGGGAFLIPYILALFAVGFPIMYMEMSFGQFASLGPITIWRISPLFKGIGFAIVVVLVLVNTYYNVLCAYALYYLFASITSQLPWGNCDNDWNTDRCVIRRSVPGEDTGNITDYNSTHVLMNGMAQVINSTVAPTFMPRVDLKTPTEEYFENHLLNRTAGIHELGNVQWPLIVCLGVSWFTCFMCLFKGIKSMGKAVIFTTIFSYLILTVLFIRGVTLPGAGAGIIYYLKPNWTKLGQLSVWGEAFSQAFASLTLGGGGWITLSSYNRFNNRFDKDVIMVGLGNAMTSLYSGFVIFSVLGYMAHIKGVDVDEVTSRGPGLAFVAYPEGLALIPGAPFWAICFFFMMFTVGLDSLFGQVETIAAGIIDEYPEFLRPRRKLFTLFLCGVMFLFGIPLVTRGGIYIVTLLDWYTLLFSFSIISLFELIVIIYIYGYARFARDIEMMIGSKPSVYYMASWLGISPITLLLVIAFLGAKYVPAYYGEYHFPPYAESIGWTIALLPCSLIPITMVVQFFRIVGCTNLKAFFTVKSFRQEAMAALFCPTLDWGPALPEIRRKYSYNATLGQPDDDVFDGAELTGVKIIDPEHPELEEKDRLVHFKEGEPEDMEANGIEKKEEEEKAKEEEKKKEDDKEKEEDVKA